MCIHMVILVNLSALHGTVLSPFNVSRQSRKNLKGAVMRRHGFQLPLKLEEEEEGCEEEEEKESSFC